MALQSSNEQFNTSQIDGLDNLLMELYPEVEDDFQGEEHIFSVSMLDGFLTSVLLSPRKITYDDVLNGVWQDEREPSFKSDEHKDQVLNSISKYYKSLVKKFDNDLTNYEPLVYYTIDGKMSYPQVDLWLDGFERGFEYFESSWSLNVNIEDNIDQILAFDDDCNFDALNADERNKCLAKLTDLVIQLHALNRSNPAI